MSSGESRVALWGDYVAPLGGEEEPFSEGSDVPFERGRTRRSVRNAVGPQSDADLTVGDGPADYSEPFTEWSDEPFSEGSDVPFERGRGRRRVGGHARGGSEPVG